MNDILQTRLSNVKLSVTADYYVTRTYTDVIITRRTVITKQKTIAKSTPEQQWQSVGWV